MFEAGLETLMMTEHENQRWEEIIVHPRSKDLPTMYALWDWLHRITDAAVAPSVMTFVLQSKLLMKVREREPGTTPWLEVLAAMCPTVQRQALREQLSDFDTSITVTPLALLDILDGMENDRTHV